MPEWRTYSIDDFVMFTSRTFDRLFENQNRALWPWHVAAIVAAVAILFVLRRGDVRANRAAGALFAAAWLVAAWSWLWLRFATIHTYGRAMAVAFAVEAVLLVWFGVTRGHLVLPERFELGSRIGVAILVYGLLLHPLLAPLLGRPWARSELFAFTPDPTVAATLGLLLATAAPWILWPIPIVWSLFSGMTLWALRTPAWWLLPGIAAVSLAFAVARRGARRRGD